MDAKRFVKYSSHERQQGELAANVAGLITCPIDLRTRKMKPAVEIIPRNSRDIAFPPAPIVDVGLINRDQAGDDGQDPYRDSNRGASAHWWGLDKRRSRSQSSTVTNMEAQRFCSGPGFRPVGRQRQLGLADKLARSRGKPRLAVACGCGNSQSRRTLVLLSTVVSMIGLIVTAKTGQAQNEPVLVPNVVDYQKLLPILPEAPPGWTADKPEGSTDEIGGFRLTNVHRDYRKGEGADAPSASISILDSAANPDYVTATTAAWNETSNTPEGYSKPVTIDDNAGFEAYENEQRHGSLWLLVAKRYFVEVELQKQDAKELQEWIKRVDLKKLAEIK
jgi:hypothetical protein